MEYPNKIYVSEYKGESSFEGKSHFVIVVAASDYKTAREYVNKLIGIDVDLRWLMNGQFPTIYTINGARPIPIQAKILYNGNYHTWMTYNPVSEKNTEILNNSGDK